MQMDCSVVHTRTFMHPLDVANTTLPLRALPDITIALKEIASFSWAGRLSWLENPYLPTSFGGQL